METVVVPVRMLGCAEIVEASITVGMSMLQSGRRASCIIGEDKNSAKIVKFV
jgi:hypothetical protein